MNIKYEDYNTTPHVSYENDDLKDQDNIDLVMDNYWT